MEYVSVYFAYSYHLCLVHFLILRVDLDHDINPLLSLIGGLSPTPGKAGVVFERNGIVSCTCEGPDWGSGICCGSITALK